MLLTRAKSSRRCTTRTGTLYPSTIWSCSFWPPTSPCWLRSVHLSSASSDIRKSNFFAHLGMDLMVVKDQTIKKAKVNNSMKIQKTINHLARRQQKTSQAIQIIATLILPSRTIDSTTKGETKVQRWTKEARINRQVSTCNRKTMTRGAWGIGCLTTAQRPLEKGSNKAIKDQAFMVRSRAGSQRTCTSLRNETRFRMQGLARASTRKRRKIWAPSTSTSNEEVSLRAMRIWIQSRMITIEF